MSSNRRLLPGQRRAHPPICVSSQSGRWLLCREYWICRLPRSRAAPPGHSAGSSGIAGIIPSASRATGSLTGRLQPPDIRHHLRRRPSVCSGTHLYAAPRHVGIGVRPRGGVIGRFRPRRAADMRYVECGLLRINLPRTPVNNTRELCIRGRCAGFCASRSTGLRATRADEARQPARLGEGA